MENVGTIIFVLKIITCICMTWFEPVRVWVLGDIRDLKLFLETSYGYIVYVQSMTTTIYSL